MLMFMLSLVAVNLGLSLAQGEICLICNCVFVNVTRVEPKPGEFNTFQFKSDAIEPFNLNTTYDSLEKYFHVDCSSENNVGQVNNLNWPKLKILGIIANFRNSKWRKLESFPTIVKKQMTVLSLAQNLITEIEDFELDEFVNLKMLNLSQNQIRLIRKGCFSKLSLLKIVDLSRNHLTGLEDWSFYGTDIQHLNLSGNSITHVTEDVFRGLNDLTVLDLSENKLTKLPDEFGNILPSLTWLSLRNNSFQRFPEFPKDLKKLDVSNNQLLELNLAHLQLEILNIRNNEIVSLSHANFPALKVLMAGHNNLAELSTLQSNQIRVLDISNNEFNKIPEVLTSDKLPFLEELYLDGNPIGNVTFPAQSEPFSDLRILSLSQLKYVKKIHKYSFKGVFPKVGYDCQKENGVLLDLSQNSIKFVDEDAFKMISVCRIDLSGNNLKYLSKNLLPWRQMSYINLQDNPWQCDCNIQWMLDDFLTFMYSNNPRQLFEMRCSTPLRYKNKMFVFWYGKSDNAFCSSGPSSFFLDLGEKKTIEVSPGTIALNLCSSDYAFRIHGLVCLWAIWTASAIACVLLGCIILLTGIVIIILLCTRPSKRGTGSRPKIDIKKQLPYTKIQNDSGDKSKTSEKWV